MPVKSIAGEEGRHLVQGSPEERKVRVPIDRAIICVLLCVLPVALLWREAYNVFASILNNETYSHIPLILGLSLYLIYASRGVIFHRIGRAWRSGAALILSGTACLILAEIDAFKLLATNRNSLLMLGLVLAWIGLFLLFFGMDSFRAALFPLLFLFFMVPVPEPILSHIIVFLQVWSSNCAAWMFHIMGRS